MLPKLDTEDSRLSHSSADGRTPITAYGHAFLDLGRIHELIIYNGMERWPMSNSFTCFPYGGGTNLVDYIVGSPALASQITDFCIPPPPPGADHTYLFFQLLTSRATTHHTPTLTSTLTTSSHPITPHTYPPSFTI